MSRTGHPGSTPAAGNHGPRWRRIGWRFALAMAMIAAPSAWAGQPVALRIESLLVTPAHTPSVVVVIQNLTAGPYRGTVTVQAPDGWSLDPASQAVSLAPAETRRISFLVRGGTNVERNAYPLAASATGGGATVVRRQTVVAASAPYFKPTIDGNIDDWQDSLPVAFLTGGRKTVIHTYWNRRRFALLVAVEEARWIGPEAAGPGEPFDAVQVALAPRGARTGTSPNDDARRYEFLLVGSGRPDVGRCYQLAEPGMKLAETQQVRSLSALRYDEAEVAVRRGDGVTYYECSIPFRPMRDRIRPSEGREFCLSVLVHDPDGTGIRDWGEAAGLWRRERNRLAWSRWPGARWGDEPPFDNKTPWGLCSSKY